MAATPRSRQWTYSSSKPRWRSWRSSSQTKRWSAWSVMWPVLTKVRWMWKSLCMFSRSPPGHEKGNLQSEVKRHLPGCARKRSLFLYDSRSDQRFVKNIMHARTRTHTHLLVLSWKTMMACHKGVFESEVIFWWGMYWRVTTWSDA